MCGIAGIVAPEGFEPSLLVNMTHLIRYRGPDGFGFAFTQLNDKCDAEIIHNQDRRPSNPRPQIGLGNRRLAILDISQAGSQPMQTEDGAYTITFNGEIYNYKEIRELLERSGHHFRTLTDTEVILHAYQQWGPDCLEHFNGMWAFALWDRPQQKLFCARDRFGVKPFYYAIYDGAFFFGSEIKQILQATGMPRVANPRTSFHFVEWGLLDYSEETFFEGVSQLPAGHTLTLEPARNPKPVIRRFWELRTATQEHQTDANAIAEFRELFQNAVSLRLRSDVPVGVALSGGLDSSSILCKAREIAPTMHFQAFSACFDDAEIDEREYIAAAIQASGGISRATFPQAKSFWERLNLILYHQDEPVGSTAAYPQWCVMAEARSHGVPVILGGQGGDEALCGYRKYQMFYLWHLFRTGNPRVLREFAMWSRHVGSLQGTLGAATRYLPGFFRAPFSLTNRIATQEFKLAARDLRSRLGSGQSIADRQRTDLTYSSIPALLHHEDRFSMAHSVESRLPFMDYRLVEFSLRCPPALKLRDGWSKWLLRKALVDTLPEKIRLRKTKLGFNTPEKSWMQIGLQNGHRQLWEVPDLRMRRFIDPVKFKTECERFVQGSRGMLAASALFRAISLELWAQVFSVS
jgi:asparagine synthase (glutamine-hydrolysing)